ncbi:S-adenosyl-L-methionine-dependent methyltransferase [Cercophora scortea]|uniref:S-adenosyl-L-methionine-dependent methyltransferase n=1 Tax=Cercophora scortea TaxID=314031 RepID=A0AAE0IAD1_9PEZI|nr:S-adenosyl-L-methionine-dependent methyltransferase [Cercophora scortea]
MENDRAQTPPTTPSPSAITTVDADPIEAEDRGDESDDGDDGYGSDLESSATTSISSSVRDFTFENNRRYHKYKEGRYHFPNDEPEQEREDMRHAMVLHLCGGKLHLAPLDNPQNILDIGTGTGIWAIDMGDEYPSAEVVGIDLSPIQPSWVPPNVRFVVDDGEARWLEAPNSQDYVHYRNMAPAIKDWSKMIRQTFTALRPGGWVELQDLQWSYCCDDGTMPPDYGPVRMAGYIRQGLEAFGIDMHASDKNEHRLADTGFINIHQRLMKLPVGTWAKDKNMKMVGLYNRSAIYDGLQGITMGPLTRGLKWTKEEVEVFLTQVRRDLMNPQIHAYIGWQSIWAQKPYNVKS